MKGVKPEWANLPRRRCDDCGKGYKPKQPVKEGQRGFCSDTCRKSYHRHGGAYRKLRVEMEKMIEKRMEELTAKVDAQILDMLPYLIVDVQEVTDYGRSFFQGSIRTAKDYKPTLAVSKPVPLPNRSRRA